MEQLALEGTIEAIQLNLRYIDELCGEQERKQAISLDSRLLLYRLHTTKLIRAQQTYIKALEEVIVRRGQKCDCSQQTDRVEPSCASLLRDQGSAGATFRVETYQLKQQLQDEKIKFNLAEHRNRQMAQRIQKLEAENAALKASMQSSVAALSKLGSRASQSVRRSAVKTAQTDITGRQITDLQVENLALSSYVERIRDFSVSPDDLAADSSQ